MAALHSCRAETEEQEAFETLTLQLTALATMAGLPQVSLQVPAWSPPRSALSQQEINTCFPVKRVTTHSPVSSGIHASKKCGLHLYLTLILFWNWASSQHHCGQVLLCSSCSHLLLTGALRNPRPVAVGCHPCALA